MGSSCGEGWLETGGDGSVVMEKVGDEATVVMSADMGVQEKHLYISKNEVELRIFSSRELTCGFHICILSITITCVDFGDRKNIQLLIFKVLESQHLKYSNCLITGPVLVH